jgi:hypothetical protein
MLPLNDSSFRISFRPTAQQVDIADPCDQSGENSNLHRVKTSCVTDAAGADDGLGFVRFVPVLQKPPVLRFDSPLSRNIAIYEVSFGRNSLKERRSNRQFA